MEQVELEKIVAQILAQLLPTTGDKELKPSATEREQPTLTVIEGREHKFQDLPLDLQAALQIMYQLQIMTLSEATRDLPNHCLLLECSLSAQAAAAQGIAGCGTTKFLQQAFISGIEVKVYQDNLLNLNEIASFDYRKQAAAHQRRLKEFGLLYVDKGMLMRRDRGRQVLVETDVDPLSRGSTLRVTKDCVISFGAKEALKEKRITLIRQ